MRIVCATSRAAAQVLTMLLAANLQPIRDFEIWPVLSITPPTTYTMLTVLAAVQVTKIGTVPDTTIVG